MIQTQITSLSKKINKQIKSFELDYPMGSYIPFWKIFRAFSNENSVIANAIKTTGIWNEKTKKDVIDIGTGDGLVLKLLAKESSNLNTYKIIEPNKALFQEAKYNLNDLKHLTAIEKDLFSLNFKKEFNSNHTILIVHVLYLLEENSLTKLLNQIPKGSKLIIVTDAINSLFSDCWNITSAKFANRSKNIHKEIFELEKDARVKVRKTKFNTPLKNPFNVNRIDLRKALLSMITYTDFELLTADEKIDVKQIFDKYSTHDLVMCESICYELKSI